MTPAPNPGLTWILSSIKEIMLEELDSIDWHAVTHAYGPSDDVPALLRSLLINDPDRRNTTMHELFSNITHQGTIYEATIYAIPFLYELLASEDTPMKSDIACLIGEIGNGYGYYQVHGPLFEHMDRADHQRSLWKRLFGVNPKIRTFTREISIEETITNRVLAAVQRQFGFLLPYLNDSNSYTRAAVAGAMGRYTEQRDAFLSLLEARLIIETDEDAQNAITNAFKSLTRTNNPMDRSGGSAAS